MTRRSPQSRTRRSPRPTPTTKLATRQGYCACGEPHGTQEWNKVVKASVCRRCHNPVPPVGATR